MPKNTNMLSKAKLVGTAIAAYGIGAPATGQTRYITFVSLNNVAGQQNVVYFASAANSANTSTVALASASQKLAVQIEAGQTQNIPDRPDSENPLFSIAAGKYLNVKTNKGNARIFVQYYDQ